MTACGFTLFTTCTPFQSSLSVCCSQNSWAHAVLAWLVIVSYSLLKNDMSGCLPACMSACSLKDKTHYVWDTNTNSLNCNWCRQQLFPIAFPDTHAVSRPCGRSCDTCMGRVCSWPTDWWRCYKCVRSCRCPSAVPGTISRRGKNTCLDAFLYVMLGTSICSG
jgi:hypothetical protein